MHRNACLPTLPVLHWMTRYFMRLRPPALERPGARNASSRAYGSAPDWSCESPCGGRGFDRCVEAAFDDVETAVPEAGIGKVDAHHHSELLRRLRTARPQHRSEE